MRLLSERLAQTLSLTNALADGLSADDLASHNGSAPSNTIGAQFWCIVGARESYARAFRAGAWQGFACSLTDAKNPAPVQAALADTTGLLQRSLTAVSQPWDEARLNILYDLLQHEAQHHGQLIRYFYANRIPFPADFAKRYALGL